MKKIGTITLISEGALVTLPIKDQQQFVKVQRRAMNFDLSTRGENISPDKAIPKPEEFLPFPFRHVTATIIGGGSWKATDFSDEKVVKKLAGMLSNRPVYLNHDMYAGISVGTNGTLTFTAARKVNGTNIPAGVDGPIWIDSVLHPDICRRLASYPAPQIDSVSTSIVFQWEPSHEFTDNSGNPDEWEFERQIGKIVEGRMVRRVVVDVVSAYETSLVWNGADPYAKMLNEKGEPMNIDKSNIVSKELFDKDPLVTLYKEKSHFFVCERQFSDDTILNLHRHEIINFSKTENPSNNPNNKIDMDFKKILATMMGVAEDQVTEDLLKQYTLTKTSEFTGIKTKADGLQAVQNDLTAEKGKVASFEKVIPFAKVEGITTALATFGKDATIETILDFAKAGKTAVDSKRATVLHSYKLAVGEKNEDQAVIDTINAADDKLLNGLMKQYGKKLGENFTGVCNSCKSTDVTFRSTTPETAEDNAGDEVKFDLANDFRN